MAVLTIRKLDEALKAKLRVRAAGNGRSMEEEARAILRIVLAGGGLEEANLYEAIRQRFGPLGGVDLDIPERDATRPLPTFD